MTWPIIACVTAAVLYGLGSVLQSLAARRAPAAKGLGAVIRQLPYLLGLLCDFVGWLLAIYAVHHLPLFAVQTTLASSVGVTAVLAWLLWRTPLRKVDTLSIGAVLVGLALVAYAAGPAPETDGGTRARLVLAVGVPIAGLIGLVAARSSRPIVAAAVSGLLFSLGATTVRTLELGTSPGALLAQPTIWAFLAYAVSGLVLHAHSLRTGHVGPVTAALWATEILVAATTGYVLFGDRVRPGALPAAVIGTVVTLGATVQLALRPSPGPAVGSAKSPLPDAEPT